MEYVYLGKITNTHGIKGEIRIISDFANKDIVFKKGFNIYIGKEKIQETLEEILKEDRAKTQVEGFTKLNLMEMTRKHICSHKD